MAGSHAFKSKAQWKWAFATRKPWAREHAHATPSFKALPRRKGAPAFSRQARRLLGR